MFNSPVKKIARSLTPIIISLLVLSNTSAAQDATCSDLASATDKQYCNSIEANSQLPTLTNGLSGSLCGYEIKRESCQYSLPHARAEEAISLERKDHHWFDQDIQPHCDALAGKHSASDLRVTSVTFGEHDFGNVCYDRDWKKKCVKWIKKVTVNCRLERTKTYFDANSESCPIVNDLSRPKECAVAFQADAGALDRRRIEVDAVLASYKREVDLYSNLVKVITQLRDAKKNLARFEYNESDVKKLSDLSDFLIEKTITDDSFKPFEATVLDVVEIVGSIDVNAGSSVAVEIDTIQAHLDLVNKELKGKERIIYLLNKQLGEINQKLVYAQSRS